LQVKFGRVMSIHGWDITTSYIWLQTAVGRHIGILLPVFVWPYHSQRYVIFHRLPKFNPNRTTPESYHPLWCQDGGYGGANLLPVSYLVTSSIYGQVKLLFQTKFGRDISIHAQILLLTVFEKKRPPYWNSTSGFDFDLIAVSGIWFCTSQPNFIQIGPPQLSYDVTSFFKMAATAS